MKIEYTPTHHRREHNASEATQASFLASFKAISCHVSLEICKSFHLMPKGLVARKRFCVGGASKDFQKKWDYNLKETERKCRDLLLEEYCDKLFTLMDSFWVEIRGKSIDIYWLVKVRGHLDKIEQEQQRIKQKKLSTLSGNSSLKKMVFERFNEHLPHFQFKVDFLCYCSSQCPELSTLSPH